ncbi:unnamed protein product [Diamesa serratosioi]
MKQMRNALKAVDNHDDYVSYMELNPQKAKKNQVRMKMVLQNYLEYEPWLSSDKDTCSGVCEDYKDVEINGVRKFYSGTMEPQIPGYVITGVRFIEKNNVIFLQIQIGKLLPLAMIDQETIHWQKVPDNIETNYIEFGYNYKKFSLDVVSFDSRIMTSFHFYKDGLTVSIKIFGHVLDDFVMGTLDTSIASVQQWFVLASIGEMSIEGKIVGLRDNFMDFTRTTRKTIKFGVSDEKTDAGQSFVPYFDGADIQFDKPAPLSGLGFMHYTNDVSYAGYIRPYIMSFKYKNVF